MDESKTIWCGNLSEKVTEELLYELFLQVGPLERVKLPTDGKKSFNYAFITFKHDVSVDYAVQLLNGTSLYDRPIIIKPRKGNNHNRAPDKPRNELSQPHFSDNNRNGYRDHHYREERYNRPSFRRLDYQGNRQNHNNYNNNWSNSDRQYYR